jgi:hypothetical protein
VPARPLNVELCARNRDDRGGRRSAGYDVMLPPWPENHEALRSLAHSSGLPVIIESESIEGLEDSQTDHLASDITREIFQRCGYRVLEQRFPRHAYVVIREDSPTTETLLVPFDDPAE